MRCVSGYVRFTTDNDERTNGMGGRATRVVLSSAVWRCWCVVEKRSPDQLPLDDGFSGGFVSFCF